MLRRIGAITRTENQVLDRISICDRMYNLLSYVLFFPDGRDDGTKELSWSAPQIVHLL